LAGTDDYVDIEKAEFAKGRGGAEEPTWRIWRAGVPAQTVPSAAEVGTGDDRQTTAVRFTVLLADGLGVDHAMRIRGPDGALYRITGWKKPQWVGGLWEIDAVREALR
jgi:hypothetical protein